MDKNGSDILSKLGAAVSGTVHNGCPSPEDLAVLAEGNAGPDLKRELLEHIGSCDSCYDTYMSMLDLMDAGEKKVLRLFGPISIAATVFIALAAFVVFFKVNIGMKDPDEKDTGFVSGPVMIKERHVEHQAAKKGKGPGEKREGKKAPKKGPVQSGKKGGRRTKAKTKLQERKIKQEKRAELRVEEEPAALPADEPAGSASGAAFRNTQGVLQKVKEPPPEPASLSVGAVKDESVSMDSRRMKSRKGLVDKLKDKEVTVAEKDNVDCFRREGDQFVRRREFVSSLPLLQTLPPLLKVVQPEKFIASEPVNEPVYIMLEILADRNGRVEKVCRLSGGSGNIGPVISAVKKWKFRNTGNAPIRFRMVLGVSGNRIIEILDKK